MIERVLATILPTNLSRPDIAGELSLPASTVSTSATSALSCGSVTAPRRYTASINCGSPQSAAYT